MSSTRYLTQVFQEITPFFIRSPVKSRDEAVALIVEALGITQSSQTCDHEKKIEEMEAEIANAAIESMEKDALIEDAKHETKMVSADKYKVERELETAANVIREMRQELATMKGEKERADNLQAKIVDMEATKQEFVDEINAFKEKVERAVEQVHEQDERLKSTVAIVAAKDKEVNALAESKLKVIAERDDLLAKIEELNATAVRLRDERSSARRDALETIKDVASFRKRLAEMLRVDLTNYSDDMVYGTITSLDVTKKQLEDMKQHLHKAETKDMEQLREDARRAKAGEDNAKLHTKSLEEELRKVREDMNWHIDEADIARADAKKARTELSAALLQLKADQGSNEYKRARAATELKKKLHAMSKLVEIAFAGEDDNRDDEESSCATTDEEDEDEGACEVDGPIVKAIQEKCFSFGAGTSDDASGARFKGVKPDAVKAEVERIVITKCEEVIADRTMMPSIPEDWGTTVAANASWADDIEEEVIEDPAILKAGAPIVIKSNAPLDSITFPTLPSRGAIVAESKIPSGGSEEEEQGLDLTSILPRKTNYSDAIKAMSTPKRTQGDGPKARGLADLTDDEHTLISSGAFCPQDFVNVPIDLDNNSIASILSEGNASLDAGVPFKAQGVKWELHASKKYYCAGWKTGSHSVASMRSLDGVLRASLYTKNGTRSQALFLNTLATSTIVRLMRPSYLVTSMEAVPSQLRHLIGRGEFKDLVDLQTSRLDSGVIRRTNENVEEIIKYLFASGTLSLCDSLKDMLQSWVERTKITKTDMAPRSLAMSPHEREIVVDQCISDVDGKWCMCINTEEGIREFSRKLASRKLEVAGSFGRLMRRGNNKVHRVVTLPCHHDARSSDSRSGILHLGVLDFFLIGMAPMGRLTNARACYCNRVYTMANLAVLCKKLTHRDSKPIKDAPITGHLVSPLSAAFLEGEKDSLVGRVGFPKHTGNGVYEYPPFFGLEKISSGRLLGAVVVGLPEPDALEPALRVRITGVAGNTVITHVPVDNIVNLNPFCVSIKNGLGLDCNEDTSIMTLRSTNKMPIDNHVAKLISKYGNGKLAALRQGESDTWNARFPDASVSTGVIIPKSIVPYPGLPVLVRSDVKGGIVEPILSIYH